MQTKLYLKILLIGFLVLSCSKKQAVTFDKKITPYNYLDKEYPIQYLYDFDSLLPTEKQQLLKKELQTLHHKKGLTVFIITKNKIGRNGNIKEDSELLNTILSKKFQVKNLVLLELIAKKRKIAITTSPNLKNKLNDSICNIILDSMKIDLKQNRFYKAFKKGVKLTEQYSDKN